MQSKALDLSVEHQLHAQRVAMEEFLVGIVATIAMNREKWNPAFEIEKVYSRANIGWEHAMEWMTLCDTQQIAVQEPN